MLQDVRQAVIVVGFSWQAEVTVHHGGLRLGHGHSQTWQDPGVRERERSDELELTCGARLVFADLDIGISDSELRQLLPVRVIPDLSLQERAGPGGEHWCEDQRHYDQHHHLHLLAGQTV